MLLWLIENTLLSLPLAGVVWLACRGLRLSPAVRHGLWLVVLLKLTTPPLFAWPAFSPQARLMAWLTGETTDAAPIDAARPIADRAAEPIDFGKAARPLPAAAEQAPDVLVEYEVFEVPLESDADIAAPAPAFAANSAPAPGAESLPAPLPVAPLPSAPTTGPAWREYFAAAEEPILAVWLLGVAAMAAVQWRRIARFRRLLAAARPAPAALVAEAAQLAERMGVRTPPLAIVPGLYSPSIWALGRPKLLWPESLEHRSLDCWSGVLVHELAHLRRRDHWVGWLELCAACCWWWNPVFWLISRELRENAELACDAWVVMLMPDSRRAYARALIDVTQLVSTRPAPLPALGMAQGARRTFERRLTMILRDRVACQAPLWALVALGVLAVAVLPRWSAGQAPAAPQAVEQPAEAPDTGEFDEDAIAPTTATFDAPLAVATAPATDAPPAADPARLAELEAQLQRLLADVQALRAQQGPNQQATVISYAHEGATAYVPQVAVVDTTSGRVSYVETAPQHYVAQTEPATVGAPPEATAAQPVAPPPVGYPVPAYGGYPQQDSGVETVTLTRAKYKLSAARAEALGQFLAAQVGSEVEVRVDGEFLIVTTTPESQQAIGAFIQFVARFPEADQTLNSRGSLNFYGTPAGAEDDYGSPTNDEAKGPLSDPFSGTEPQTPGSELPSATPTQEPLGLPTVPPAGPAGVGVPGALPPLPEGSLTEDPEIRRP